MAKNDADISSERKGLVYEAFVALAIETELGGVAVMQPKLDGVIADQDIAWPDAKRPRLLASVTHWGSHEAAKMKFWRIHEDLFECHARFPRTPFLSVVFERNPTSDENLCALLESVTAEMGLSDLNCPAILQLQAEVESEHKIGRFFKSRDPLDACKTLRKESASFRESIAGLGKEIAARYSSCNKPKALQSVLDLAVQGAAPDFRDPGQRITWFKPALIQLIEIGCDLATVFASYRAKKLDDLPLELHKRLVSIGCLQESEDSLDVEYEPSPALAQLLQEGESWCTEQQNLIRDALNDPAHSMHSYHDHVSDILDGKACADRLDRLVSARNKYDILQLITTPDRDMHRRWAVDYAVIITRAHTRGGRYGFSKLSEEIRVPYLGGVSALPRYVAGEQDALSRSEIDRLATSVLRLRDRWDSSLVDTELIERDRRITLRKKLSVLDLVIEASLRKALPHVQFQLGARAHHPLSGSGASKNAGVTEFNLVATKGQRRAIIFVVFSDDATHKHKELSGRIRGARASGFVSNDDLCIILVDGNLLGDAARDARIRMLQLAGWRGAYFMDEIDDLADAISKHMLIGSRSRRRIGVDTQEMPLAAEQSGPLKLKRKRA